MKLSLVTALSAWITVVGVAPQVESAAPAAGTSAVVTFEPSSVTEGNTFTATFSGTNIGSAAYVDVRFRAPDDNEDQLSLNWQSGTSAIHTVAAGTAAGAWTITGFRAHESADDHHSDFIPVLAVLAIDPIQPNTTQSLVEMRPAAHLLFPGEVDSNSPAFWDDKMYLFNSAGGLIKRSDGTSLETLGDTQVARFKALQDRVNYWIEAVWKTPDGILWGWYHAEPWDSVCPNLSVLGRTLTAPEIGAAVSPDDGLTWYDLGIVLKADPTTLVCDTPNGYFSGGVGDLSVMLDDNEEYLYIFFGTYSGTVSEQGVSVARMRWSDRNSPVGNVWRWYNGSWDSSGLEGRSTPLFPATVDWNSIDANAFWGPSIHWNTYLNRYVILLNRTKGPNYAQEGIYITFSSSLFDFQNWTIPRKIVDGGVWYPQIIGVSDKLAGETARFFDGGLSEYELAFSQIEPTCTLSADKLDYVVGDTAHFSITSNLQGLPVYWYGTKDGVTDVESLYFGRTNIVNLDYGPFAGDLVPAGDETTTYTRYVIVKDDAGNPVCRSNTIVIRLRTHP